LPITGNSAILALLWKRDYGSLSSRSGGGDAYGTCRWVFSSDWCSIHNRPSTYVYCSGAFSYCL